VSGFLFCRKVGGTLEQTLLAFFQTQGPWALLFVGLFLWVLRENQKREARLIDVIDRLSDKYDEMAADLREIKDSLRLGGR
jgi:protein-S-isoprenylcysteine O-methyltransferase Ste14